MLMIYLAALVILILACVILKKEMQYWIFSYVKWLICDRKHMAKNRPVDIIFCIVDHFELGVLAADPSVQAKRVDVWLDRYPGLADRHHDSDGQRAVHTWFFPPHDDINSNLEKLTVLCKEGYGEIELHLHHDRIPPFPDSAETLERKIRNTLSRYSSLGIFGLDKENRKVRFGFVHGDWALNNSCGGKHCGVNNELQILSRLGCYADFTFPSICRSQPKKINSMYYAKDMQDKPKSHDSGVDVEVVRTAESGLMIIEGPLGLRFKRNWRSLFIAVEAGNISRTDLPIPSRVDFWVNSAIHVKGRPNWIFIKVHTHGALEANAHVLLGDDMDKMYSYMEKKYNDGDRFRLHYVTAREMYNIIKAAESGQDGNPARFRDYIIGKPSLSGSVI